MGAQTQNQRLAGSAADRLRAAQMSREGIEQRRAAIRQQEQGRPETGRASMFPNEAPSGPPVPPPSGLEELSYQRGEVTRARDMSGRREEMYRQFQEAAANRGEKAEVTPGGAVERGAGVFGASFGGGGQGGGLRSGIQFGPGRSTRMPDVGTPEYNQLIERVRALGIR